MMCVSSPSTAAVPHFLARRSLGAGGCSMKITEDVRKYATERGITEEEAPAKCMAAKSEEFSERRAEFNGRS